MKRFIFMISMVLLFAPACKKDFLEVVDKTIILQEGYVVDLKTTGHYLNGIYAQLASSYALGATFPYPNLIADDMKPEGDGIAQLGEPYGWKEPVNKMDGITLSKSVWNTMYKVIKCSNFVIEKSLEFSAENPDYSRLLKSQALAIRSWMHFMLVNTFAQSYNFTANASHVGVPYVKTSDVREVLSRQPVEVVYNEMIADLNEALQYLPPADSNKERMNRSAAQALLARIYLFKGDYVQSKSMSRAVLHEFPIMTTGYPELLYTKDESEALFHLAPPYSEADRYTPIFMGYFTSANVIFLATSDITELYRSFPDDKRNNWVVSTGAANLINKFPKGATGTFLIPEGDHYQNFFRSSEMALTAAEAYAHLSIQDSARYFINAIRTRTGVPELMDDVSGVALMDSIKLERRKEMAFDGIRMFDLLRWKQGVTRADALNGSSQNLPYPSNRAIFPIPFEDVQIARLQQNEGY